MNEIWLAGVSGAVLVTLLALQVTLSVHLAWLHDAGREASDSVYSRTKDLRTGGPLAAALTVCFFIYMAYALLPIRLRHACIAGIVFSAAHLIGALLLYPHDYPSIMAHVSPTSLCEGHEESSLRKQLPRAAKNNGARSNRPFMIIFLPLAASPRHFRRNGI